MGEEGEGGGTPQQADGTGGGQGGVIIADEVSADATQGSGSTVPTADIAARAGMRSADYDPYRHLAETRRSIAAWLIIILAFTILLVGVLPLLYLVDGQAGDFEQVKDVLQIVFAPLVTLVTAVTAFYFGERAGSSRPG